MTCGRGLIHIRSRDEDAIEDGEIQGVPAELNRLNRWGIMTYSIISLAVFSISY